MSTFGYEVAQFITDDFGSIESFEKYVSEESLMCHICLLVANTPYTSTVCCDMAVICKSCIEHYYQTRRTKCPTCNKDEVTFDKFRLNRRAQKCINGLQAKCILDCGFGTEDCKTLETVLVHQEKMCIYKMTECEHCNQQIKANLVKQHFEESCISSCSLCHTEMLTRLLPDHLVNDCEERSIPCIQCGLHIVFKNQDIHNKNTCERTIIDCILNCGKSYERRSTEIHKQECSHAIVTCSLCPYQGQRKDMEAHQTDRLLHLEYNMTLLETRMALVEKERTQLIKENNFLTTLLPMCLPPSITTLYNVRYVKMDLTNLTKHHYCDFCKKTIPNQCGYLGYHVKNSGSGIDKCLSCASIHFVNNLNNKDE